MKSLKHHINESLDSVNEAARYIEFKKIDEDFVRMWNYANGFEHNTEYPNGFIAHYLYLNGNNAARTNISVAKFIENHKNDKWEVLKIEKRKPYPSGKMMHVVDFKVGKYTGSIYSKIKISQ